MASLGRPGTGRLSHRDVTFPERGIRTTSGARGIRNCSRRSDLLPRHRGWRSAGDLAARGYRVIAFDRRGWGRTVIDPTEPQPGTAAGDLLALLDDLGLDRVHVVGT